MLKICACISNDNEGFFDYHAKDSRGSGGFRFLFPVFFEITTFFSESQWVIYI